MIVTIVGASMMGTATSFPAADAGHHVRLVGTSQDRAVVEALGRGEAHPGLGVPIPPSVRAMQVESLAAAVATSEAVVLGVSSAGVRWAADALSRTLRRPLPIAMVTKGLDVEHAALRILPDVLRDLLPAPLRVEPVAIGGPCIAGELARRAPSVIVFAGRDTAAASSFARSLATPYYRAVESDDPVGVCVCAALKNAYATAVGIAAGLHERSGGAPGSVALHNLEAAIFARALAEMQTVAVALGGLPETVLGLAGAGDLFVTTSGGRSSRLGRLLGLGRTFAEARAEMGNPTLEAAEIAEVVHRAGAFARHDLRLLEILHAVLFEGAPAGGISERVR